MTLEEYRNNLLPSDRSLFDEFVTIGIRKTIYALLDANVDLSLIHISPPSHRTTRRCGGHNPASAPRPG